MSNIQKIFLPKLGESTAEATIIEWHKQVGETVELDEDLLTIGTDKVDSELPSEFEGTLVEILANEGDIVKVGAPIAVIETENIISHPELVEGHSEPAERHPELVEGHSEPVERHPELVEGHPEPVEVRITEKQLDKKFLSPVVRKIASEHGLTIEDLKKIKGNGIGNRIKKSDILSYLNPENPVKRKKKDLNIQANDTVEKLSRIRSLTAKHLSESYQNIPHVTTIALADVTNLVNVRNQYKNQIQEKNGVKITFTHLMMFLMIENLKRFPKFNAWMNEDELILKHDINLGFATATPDGNLLVPNIKKSNEMNLLELTNQVNNISSEAKQNKVNPDNLKDTSFTMSNTGIFGSLMGTPIISQPQVAVIALGEINSTPSVKVENEKEIFAVRKKMYLSLSYDHRVIDGALASRFLTSYKNLLEDTDFEEMLDNLV